MDERSSTGHSEIDSQVNHFEKAELGFSQGTENPFRAIFDLIDDAIFVLDLKTGVVIDINQRVCGMYGITREEALQLRAGDICPAEPPCAPHEALRRFHDAALERPKRLMWRTKCKTGRPFQVETTIKQATIDGRELLLVILREVKKETVITAEKPDKVCDALSERLQALLRLPLLL